jgi:enolase
MFGKKFPIISIQNKLKEATFKKFNFFKREKKKKPLIKKSVLRVS